MNTPPPVHGGDGCLRFAKQALASFPEFFPVEKQMLPGVDFSTVEYPNPEEGEGALVSQRYWLTARHFK